MKTFKEFLKESMSDNAYVFDVDDTIVSTKATVLVKDQQGNVIKKLTPSEYNTYKKAPGESLDFTQFKSADIFKKTAEPTRYFKVIKSISDAIKHGHSNSYIYILTARGNDVKNAIHQYLKSKGVEVRSIDIHTIGDDESKSIAELKKDVLQNIRNKHIGEVTFFDDDHKNILLAKQIPGITARLVKT